VSSAPARVLIAEDEALIRLDLKEMLEEEGYEVVAEVGDGQQAVDRATELSPDLVILDIQMPVLDGLSAAEQIASARIAPVIVLTAFSQRELVERARDAGAMAYLVKPFSKNDLVPAIEVAMGRFAEMAALDGEVRTLEERLAARQVVEKAKGRLMAERGVTEGEAFRWLQRTAMNERTSMKALAERILADGVPSGAGSD
jgi:two-component system, response regulator PdtaR